MNIEFHYYITYILARKGGYDQTAASTIAYACQYTDDNNDIFKVKRDKEQDDYENYISQTMNINKPKNKLVRIYSCFHFFPGSYENKEAQRNDGALHIFNTTPNSEAALEMFRTTLDSNNLYRIGIATHCYSDTWAHQNFVGFKHAFGSGKGLLAKAIPNIGHADFQHMPDIPNLLWTDSRLLKSKQEISNKKRFLSAAQKIFEAFANCNGLKNTERLWAELAGELKLAIGADSRDVKECNRQKDNRIRAYRKICPDMPEYDEEKWKHEALNQNARWLARGGDCIRRRIGAIPVVGSLITANYWPKCLRIRNFKAKDGFEKSNWLAFQEAVKEHQEIVMELLKERYDQIGASMQKTF